MAARLDAGADPRHLYLAAPEAQATLLQDAAAHESLGRSAYTYFHLPMVAGIIAIAASDELTVAILSSAAHSPLLR